MQQLTKKSEKKLSKNENPRYQQIIFMLFTILFYH